MTELSKIPQELLSSLEIDGLTQRVGKITAICDFPSSEGSTFFFRDSDDPSWYVWFPMTREMHPTILSILENPDYRTLVLIDGAGKLNRLLVYSA
ncbi:hypothetical protein [Amorphus orientalis]|uniref:Uncharacterized protein n=1 Tax=Amorphus orientalis TaxID=649198 RepID=A0AAE4ATT1_9HYPH|nr:hypothetical protein [Amorphus orientalis]MDQ0315269.1 hypothetical protein [Amorphus orientalis]